MSEPALKPDECKSVKMAMGDIIGDCQLCADLQSDLGKARAENERHMREKVELAGLVSKERDEVGRLLDALKAIECHSIDHTDACRMAGMARRVTRADDEGES